LQIADQFCTSEKDACGVGFIYRPENSNRIVKEALTALARMEHRGACGADGITSDGAGIMTVLPLSLFEREGWRTSERTAVGMFFLPHEQEAWQLCRQLSERFLKAEGFEIQGWRHVPLNENVLGPQARETAPQIQQLFIEAPTSWSSADIDCKLLAARKRLSHFVWSLGEPYRAFYVVSLSARTIVYKGMVRSQELPAFYLDLANPHYKSTFAVYHRRFSTNTLPNWRLAQPFRVLGHNGEINTVMGNRVWMQCRETVLEEELTQKFGPYPSSTAPGASLSAPGVYSCDEYENQRYSLLPLVSRKSSDSGSLDNTIELLMCLGRSPESAIMQLIADAHRNNFEYDGHPEIAAFNDYFAGTQEPWDGPALIVYSDGNTVGAKLDRNGMRPARYTVLKDGSVFLSSETGVVDFDDAEVQSKGRLGPGQMMVVDIASGRLKCNLQLKLEVACEHPYSDWLKEQRIEFACGPFADGIKLADSELLGLQMAYGYGKEDVAQILNVMASVGHEPVYSMGDDTPLAVLSAQPRLLYDYFKQRFAQVTNPPIDHLRERLVMSLDSYLGKQTGWHQPTPEGARLIHLTSPIINEAELKALCEREDFPAVRLSLLFDIGTSLHQALEELCQKAVRAVEEGAAILVLSDRGVGPRQGALPPLLALGAVHHELVRLGLRLQASIVVEAAQCWATHHFACLFGFGAEAVCPYLAFEIVRHATRDTSVKNVVDLSIEAAQANYKLAVEEGLLKVLSKMGISSLSSYIGAQIFECIGLGPELSARCFKGTTSRIGGKELPDIEREILDAHRRAFPFGHKQLINFGMISPRTGGEYHGNNPKIVRALHQALGISQKVVSLQERQEQFQQYSSLVRDRPPSALRDMLAFKSDRRPIALDQVESAEAIVKTFCTGGMSLGALSKESHEMLAIAMNRLGAKSNSGEGGEDPQRYYPIADVTEDGTSKSFPGLRGLKAGDTAGSAVRQVASARFGVTPEYLVTARQLEIKIAQGAKPGEGGQLPAHKVSKYIAKLRRAKEGMALISPPPHHDIYSIEDLAQLIYDLRQVSKKAKISVKLVAQVGVGAVAVGVAKANADIIQVSGNDGGTGASALSSIKHAGAPWELGLVEVHRSLLENNLRHRVLLRVDGGLKSGWEIVVAAMLGANEYGFGSIALIAQGCIMARICHTNNCPVGITSQKEKLRERFTGIPDQIVEFFLFIAEEVRLTLAELGYTSLSDVLGRSDLLKAKVTAAGDRTERVNLDYLLQDAAVGNDWKSIEQEPHHDDESLNDLILADAEVDYAIKNHQAVIKAFPIKNTDRSVGAAVGGKLAGLYGDTGFKGKLALIFEGVAGQSFGAFIVDNVKLTLTGEANDYVGKGMGGGEIVVKFPQSAAYESWQNVIVGNTCLYGATGGSLFCAGQAGERFAVRNSGAQAVVEGTGDHGCEYMTGGAVVVLGRVGRNFAAGMTGGLAYVLDLDGDFVADKYCGESDKQLQPVPAQSPSEAHLRQLIDLHLLATGSKCAETILNNWNSYLPLFKQIVPAGEENNELFLNQGLNSRRMQSI
jgi:glutamate synthase (ferredoxin)